MTIFTTNDCSGHKRCVREHVKDTFVVVGTAELPTPEKQADMLENVAAGSFLPKPFDYDWSSSFSSSYNQCVEEAFSSDFWACADAGKYDVAHIPLQYQSREGFIALLRRHLGHKKRKWVESQRNPSASRTRAVASHYARNSRIRTASSSFLTHVSDTHEIPLH